MSSQTKHELPPPLDLTRWRSVPALLMGIGATLSFIGVVVSPEQFGFSWLLSFMFSCPSPSARYFS